MTSSENTKKNKIFGGLGFAVDIAGELTALPRLASWWEGPFSKPHRPSQQWHSHRGPASGN